MCVPPVPIKKPTGVAKNNKMDNFKYIEGLINHSEEINGAI
jgi:hypothetical protein